MKAPATAGTWAYAAPSSNARVVIAWLPNRLRAIDELRSLGYPAEAYALLHETLREAASALREAAPERAAEIEALQHTATPLARPLDERAFGATHAAWSDVARALCERLRREHAERRSHKPLYIALGLSIVCGALAVFGFYATRLTANASATYAHDYPARHAVDGLETTEWLLPDGKMGSIDIGLPWRRAVHGVTLTNAHNRAYVDRAIKKARVQVFDDDRVVDSLIVEFGKIEPVHVARRFVLKGAEGTRVRITVLQHHGLGGGLAEVSVD